MLQILPTVIYRFSGVGTLIRKPRIVLGRPTKSLLTKGLVPAW
jgi:hypothetical protein